ncbi:hypothetical protein F4779DRAFT_637676 [Xylariaceae sp. FL0662B]|nr:hypothetical protein F4779DRAFT_637676 [Xylariaceae sp. FL0662B]
MKISTALISLLLTAGAAAPLALNQHEARNHNLERQEIDADVSHINTNEARDGQISKRDWKSMTEAVTIALEGYRSITSIRMDVVPNAGTTAEYEQVIRNYLVFVTRFMPNYMLSTRAIMRLRELASHGM